MRSFIVHCTYRVSIAAHVMCAVRVRESAYIPTLAVIYMYASYVCLMLPICIPYVALYVSLLCA